MSTQEIGQYIHDLKLIKYAKIELVAPLKKIWEDSSEEIVNTGYRKCTVHIDTLLDMVRIQHINKGTVYSVNLARIRNEYDTVLKEGLVQIINA